MTYEEFKEKVGSVILTGEGNCPVTPVVQMLQGKWKLQILYELCIKCPMRFGELKKMLKPITNTALTNALKELEADELVQRIQYNEMPLRVEYSLTEKGRDLLPVFYAISQWGMKYIPQTSRLFILKLLYLPRLPNGTVFFYLHCSPYSASMRKITGRIPSGQANTPTVYRTLSAEQGAIRPSGRPDRRTFL